MDGGTVMAKNLDAFDELVVDLQTLGEHIDEAQQFVVLLSSLPGKYELVSSIIDNAKVITLIEVKEKLLKDCKWLKKREMTPARTFKINTGRFKRNKGNGLKLFVRKKNASDF